MTLFLFLKYMGLNFEEPEKSNWVYFARFFACLFCTSFRMSILHVYFAGLFGFQLMVHKCLLDHLAPSSPTWASNFSCFLLYSWFLPENIQQGKGNECSQYKRTAAIFSSSLSICPVYFHLVMPVHVFSPCYARYGRTRGIKRYVTYYLAFYVRLHVQILPYY